jgi:protein phosphatase
MRVRAGAVSDVGRVRRINEDAHLADLDRGLFVVCDGMGGEAAGDVASRTAIDTIAATLTAPVAASDETAGGYRSRTIQLREAIRAANARIRDRARQEPALAGMGTTVVAAWLSDSVASLAHVGDSRAYLWHDGQLERLTTDHSFVEEDVRAGRLDRESSLQAEHQNVLLRALGGGDEVDVEIGEAPVQPGSRLLLCSDGLTRMVPESAMATALGAGGEPAQICQALVDAANGNGGVDNVTVIVVEIPRRSWSQWLSRR